MLIIPPFDITEGPRTIYIPPGVVDPPIVTDPDIEILLEETPLNNVTHSISGGLVHLTGNPIEITLQAVKLLPNHRLVLQVSCPLLVTQAPEKIAPDKDLKAVFDISGLIDSPVVYDFDYPPMGLVKAYTDYVFVVTLKIGEEYTDVNGDKHTTWMNIEGNDDVIRVLKGKLRPFELAALAEDGKSFAVEYIDLGRFLTHLPSQRTVMPGQIMKLWYLGRWNVDKEAKMCMSLIFDDGYWAIENKTVTRDFTLVANGLFEFSVEPYFFGAYFPLTGWTDELRAHLQSFTFFLRDEAGFEEDMDDPSFDISERITFEVDRKFYETMYEFHYVNPLSGIDNVVMTGELLQGLKTESETMKKPIPFGAGTKISGFKKMAAPDLFNWEINTGYKTKAEMIEMRDFLSSTECWMSEFVPGVWRQLIPVVIEDGNFTLAESDNDIPNITIKVSEAY